MKTNAHLLKGLAHSRCTIIGSHDFQYLFITINAITPPVLTFLPLAGNFHLNIIHKVPISQLKLWDGT